MHWNRQRTMIFLAAVLTFAACGSAPAQVVLHFEPADQALRVGETGVLTVELDEVVDLRTVAVRVTYDHTLLGSLSGEPGALFETFRVGNAPTAPDPGEERFPGETRRDDEPLF